MEKNIINYENYKAHKQKYAHVSTWMLWNYSEMDVKGNDFIAQSEIRKKLLIANSEVEYKEKELAKSLNGDVVVLALNFSCPKEAKNNPNPLLRILNEYKDESSNKKRYEELQNLVENDERFTFYNMYEDAGRYYAPEFMKSDTLRGAYMTDLVKFVEDNGEIIPAGIPDSDSAANIITECMSKDKIAIQAKGLKAEFDLLGIKPKVIILVHSRLRDSKYLKDAIEKELGYMPAFEYLHHYTPNGSSYKKRGFNSYNEMYSSEIRQVLENIESKI